jgi:glucokinase
MNHLEIALHMTVLIADVGGTNARLALVIDGLIDKTSIEHFSNEACSTFYDVVRTYLELKSKPDIHSCVVAVAGPVGARSATLTNRNWEITTDQLKQLTQSQNAVLINDLSSLGYATTNLPKSGLQTVWTGKPQPKENTQFLVVGIGTGFNICAVKTDQSERPICLQAECGHITMPATVLAYLDENLATQFKTIEDLFSGRGLSKLHAMLTKSDPIPGNVISQQHKTGSDIRATETLEIYAKMLAAVTRELLLMYMPSGGIYFAGSVGRGVFNAGMGSHFTKTLQEPHFISDVKDTPIHVITEDTAGLTGCAVLARQL